MDIADLPQPKDIDDAIEILVSAATTEDKVSIREAESVGAIMGVTHHSFGMALRNHWKLWFRDTPAVEVTEKKYGVSHADDVSGLIMQGFFAKVRGETFDFEAEAAGYRAHWAAMKAGDRVVEVKAPGGFRAFISNLFG